MALKVYFIVGDILSHPFPDVMLSQAWLYLDRGVFLASFWPLQQLFGIQTCSSATGKLAQFTCIWKAAAGIVARLIFRPFRLVLCVPERIWALSNANGVTMESFVEALAATDAGWDFSFSGRFCSDFGTPALWACPASQERQDSVCFFGH